MELLIIRHSIAAPTSLGGLDRDRPLTDEGRALFGQASSGLGHLQLRLTRVLHSPLLRAVQTADLLQPLLDGERHELALMARPPGMELMDELLSAGLGGGRVAAVGHQPYVSELTSLLLTGDSRLAMGLAFSPGTVAWLRGRPRPGQMALLGLMSPQVLAASAPRPR